MSLSRLASQQVARTVGPFAAAADAAVAQPDKDDRFDLLTKYIPTETLMLYVAAMAILPAIESSLGIGAAALYIGGAVLTPLMFLLAALGKLRMSRSTERFRPQPWPPIAATIAFLAWALSVPGFLTNQNDQILAGFAALVVSTLLGLLDAIVQGGDRA